MINVLPPETKKQLRAARFNVIVRNYYLLLGGTIVLLAGVFAVGLYTSDNQKAAANNDFAAAQQEAVAYSATSKAADQFAKDLEVDKTILAGDIRFSTLLTDIATVIPSCVILSNLAIGTTNLATPLTISGRSCTYDDGVKLKNSLEASSLFEKVKLTSATTTDPTSLSLTNAFFARYPVVLTLTAQFSKQPTAQEAKK